MQKARAIELLGGTVTSAAAAIGITPSAVTQWPSELPKRLVDRVLAALARRHLSPELIGEPGAPAANSVSAGTEGRGADAPVGEDKPPLNAPVRSEATHG